MNTIFALYIPKFAEGSLGLRFVLFVALVVALIVYARQRWGFILSTISIIGCGLAAVLPKLITSLNENLGWYGHMCREKNQSTLPDWYFVIFAYFDVGEGTFVLLAGTLGGWLLLEFLGRLGSFFIKQIKKVCPGQDQRGGLV